MIKKKPPRLYLKEWRKRVPGLTQERLAERVDMATPSISQLESGQQGYTQETLAALAFGLNIEVADLFRDPNAPDYESWRIFKNMNQDARRQALKILKAIAEEDAA